ncbi:hypothetical protein [Chlamydia caviae]|uniref:Conserved domain protein n=1 Tax=Chlamydia caviae (strain ATCC VR-813 / DSM 19441 / 03DC25 / GPIC) TaxID=227941 RepID=Q822N4_CHLCV|nr:hypothetical protein [Chlamydia caviae]AAP05389.1 conserved domain protein [Chlamydia caviae GPIC]
MASWKTCQEDGDEVTLSRDYIGFDIVLTTHDFAGLEAEAVINEEPQRCYIHQELQRNLPRDTGSQVIRTKLGNLTYVLPILRDSLTPNENADTTSQEEINEAFYKIFKSFFTKYYIALNASVAREKIITLQLLRSGCPDLRVRQMEIFALFCAIEQMHFTQTPETPSLFSNTVASQQLPVSPLTSPTATAYGQLRTSPTSPPMLTPQFDSMQRFLAQERHHQNIPTDASQTSVHSISGRLLENICRKRYSVIPKRMLSIRTCFSSLRKS